MDFQEWQKTRRVITSENLKRWESYCWSTKLSTDELVGYVYDDNSIIEMGESEYYLLFVGNMEFMSKSLEYVEQMLWDHWSKYKYMENQLMGRQNKLVNE